jgi:primosomal replication protein N
MSDNQKVQQERDFALLSLHGKINNDVILRHNRNGIATLQFIITTQPGLKDPARDKDNWLETEKFSIRCRATGSQAVEIANKYMRGNTIKVKGFIGLLEGILTLYVTDLIPPRQRNNSHTKQTVENQEQEPDHSTAEDAHQVPDSEVPTEPTPDDGQPIEDAEQGEWYNAPVLPTSIRIGKDQFELSGVFYTITEVREDAGLYTLCLDGTTWLEDKKIDPKDRVTVHRQRIVTEKVPT